jgi:hypothetical protein
MIEKGEAATGASREQQEKQAVSEGITQSSIGAAYFWQQNGNVWYYAGMSRTINTEEGGMWKKWGAN